VNVLRKIVAAIILVPLAVLIVGFAVTNRQAVTISFDPFSSANPAYAVTLPLFITLFIALILGVLLGGLASWIRQGKWRRAARRLDADIHAIREELHTLRQHHARVPEPPAQADPNAQLMIPPPAA
jgi:uncharacterized integral membrane protein